MERNVKMDTTRSITWAAAEDWAKHRLTITHLYENKTLNEVIEIMRQDHSFFATAKMFKVYLKRWGLSKNLAASDVEMILRGSEGWALANRSTVLIRGRPVDYKKVERYLRRKKNSIVTGEPFRGAKDNALSSTTILPLATLNFHLLRSPDDFRLPEEIMLLCRQLVIGSRDNGIWASDQNNNLIFATETTVKWDHDICEGILLFNSRKYKHAFKVLDRTFDLLGRLILNYDPALFRYVITNALWSHVDIGQRLLSYTAEMSKVKLAANHPMGLIWDRLSQMGIPQLKKWAWSILLSYIKGLEEAFGSLSGEDCTRLMLSTIKNAELLGERAYALQAKSTLVGILISEKKYYEATKVMREIDEDNYESNVIYDEKVQDDSLRHHFAVCRSMGTVEEAVQAGRRYLEYCQNRNGRESPEALQTASTLKKYIDDVGWTDKVERLEESLNPDWDAFCQKIEDSL